jgi:prepilin-type N-terminal cleavage/methylation domain-containing protein
LKEFGSLLSKEVSKVKRKTNGFTLIEIVISMAISLIVLIIISSFWITNSNTLQIANMRSDLQREGEKIQTRLMDNGGASIGISNISLGAGIDPQSPESSNGVGFLTPPTDSLDVNKLEFDLYRTEDPAGGRIQVPFIYEDRTLSFIDRSGNTVILSENVDTFTIKPLDATTQTDDTLKNFNATIGIQVDIGLRVKRGRNEISYPVSTIIKFRNKGK